MTEPESDDGWLNPDTYTATPPNGPFTALLWVLTFNLLLMSPVLVYFVWRSLL